MYWCATKLSSDLRCKHAIGQHGIRAPLSHRAYFLSAARTSTGRRVSHRPVVVETVHPAVRAGNLTGSVAVLKHRMRRVDPISYVIFSDIGCSGIFFPDESSPSAWCGPRIALKHIVEASVLLNDVHDVGEFFPCCLRRGTARAHCPQRRAPALDSTTPSTTKS